MKAFIAEGTGAAQQLSGIQNEKIPIYGSKADAEADIENLEEEQIVATKENGFSSDGVYIASSSAITGGDLIANSSMKIMFISDIVGEDTNTPLSISWNGESYLVKVANNSQLQNIYAHEVSSGVFKYVQAYTTLELIFDGVQFIIVGNPLVLSSSTYSIYANGYDVIGYNSPDWAHAQVVIDTLVTGQTLTPQTYTFTDDGFVAAHLGGSSTSQTFISINGIRIGGGISIGAQVELDGGAFAKVSKGDVVQLERTGGGNFGPAGSQVYFVPHK